MQIRALLLEDKIRDQTLAEQQQKQLEQQAKTMGSRAGGVGSTSGQGQFSLKQPSVLSSSGSNNSPTQNNQIQSSKTPYTPSGSYIGGSETPTSSLDRRYARMT